MFTFFQIIDLSHSFSQIIYIFAVVNQLNSLLILITDTNFKFKKTKMKMQSIMRISSAVSRDLPRKRRKLSKRWRRPSRMSTTPRTK